MYFAFHDFLNKIYSFPIKKKKKKNIYIYKYIKKKLFFEKLNHMNNNNP